MTAYTVLKHRPDQSTPVLDLETFASDRDARAHAEFLLGTSKDYTSIELFPDDGPGFTVRRADLEAMALLERIKPARA